jgi:hypothetical protein
MTFLITENPIQVTIGEKTEGFGVHAVANIEDLANLKTSLLVDVYNLLKPADEAPVKVFQSKAKAIPRVWALMCGLLPSSVAAPSQPTEQRIFLLTYPLLDIAAYDISRFADRKTAKQALRAQEARGNKYAAFLLETPADCNNEYLQTSTICDLLRIWGYEETTDRAAAQSALLRALNEKFGSIELSDGPPAAEPEGEEMASTKKRGNAEPRKPKATTERKAKVAKEPKTKAERKPRVSTIVLGEGKAVRESSSLARLVELMLRGKYTMNQIISMSKIEDTKSFTAKQIVEYRIKNILRNKHGIDHNIDANGIVSAVLPKGFTEENIYVGKKAA